MSYLNSNHNHILTQRLKKKLFIYDVIVISILFSMINNTIVMNFVIIPYQKYNNNLRTLFLR